jgi:hypothetical protein
MQMTISEHSKIKRVHQARIQRLVIDYHTIDFPISILIGKRNSKGLEATASAALKKALFPYGAAA